MSRFLVTGSTGFLGRHLVKSLVDHGHTVVEFAFETGGNVLDRACVDRALADGTFDGVFHCAGRVSRRPEDAEMLHELHVTGTKNVLDACIAKGVKRVVVASTSGVVAVSDDPDHVATEDDEAPIGLINRWPYYRSKLFAEKAAFERHGQNDLEVVCVNPTILFGPGDVNGSSTEDIRLFLERKIPAIPPGGLSYVDARDAAEGMRLAMEKGVGGRRYLLGACNMTFREFFARLERVSGVRGPIVPMPRAPELSRTGAGILERLAGRIGVPLPVDPVSLDMSNFYWYLDASLAESELGWSPRDPTETLADTVKDLELRGIVWPETGSSLISTLAKKVTRDGDRP